MRRTILTAAAAGLTTAIAVVGVATAAAGTKTEHLSFMSTERGHSEGAGYSAIATGAFTDGGIVLLQGDAGTLRLQKGTIKIRTKPGKSSLKINPKTCLGVATEPGTYKLVSGSGAYKGITGSGRYVAHFTEVGKIAKGKCSRTADPVAVQGIIKASGSVTPR